MKNIVVIGAGISGLSAAIYAQRSGFEVTLCEQNSVAGGVCTSWKRKGYLFEGAVHWMTGSSPKTALYQLWKETGALNDGVKVFLHEPFQAVQWEGQTISLYRDIEKTAEQFLILSPRDKKQIRRLVSDVKAFSRMQLPVFDIKGVKAQNPKRLALLVAMLKLIPVFPALARLTKMSVKDFAAQFEHPAIRQLLNSFPDDYSAINLIATLATLAIGDGGYPEGGSLAMVDRMTKTFIDLGGKLLLKTKAKKVNIENGVVTGVTLENGTLNADAVIVTQETIAAIDQLFDIPLNEPWLTELCKNTKPTVCTFVCLGVRAELPPVHWVCSLEKPIAYAGTTLSKIDFYSYSGMEGFAPKGCTALTTALLGDTYHFWKKAKEEGRYEEEKKRLALQISQIVSRIYPQAEGHIEVMDIATPLTYERYTGAYHGSWMSVVNVGDKMKNYPGDLESVKGLYFAGHRLLYPGGLPVALASGRLAAQMVCRQFNRLFKNGNG